VLDFPVLSEMFYTTRDFYPQVLPPSFTPRHKNTMPVLTRIKTCLNCHTLEIIYNNFECLFLSILLFHAAIASLYHSFERRVNKMKIQPLNDRILVLRVKEEEKTSGGIIIPDTAKEKPQEGKIVAVGPGKLDETGKRISLEVKPGDRVLFGKYAGTEIKIDGVEHLIMREDDILGVIES
jgi:chaperonin GroES